MTKCNICGKSIWFPISATNNDGTKQAHLKCGNPILRKELISTTKVLFICGMIAYLIFEILKRID